MYCACNSCNLLLLTTNFGEKKTEWFASFYPTRKCKVRFSYSDWGCYEEIRIWGDCERGVLLPPTHTEHTLNENGVSFLWPGTVLDRRAGRTDKPLFSCEVSRHGLAHASFSKQQGEEPRNNMQMDVIKVWKS